MSDYKIEKGIAKPPAKRPKPGPWPFATMAVTDSFAVPVNGEIKTIRARVGSAIKKRREVFPKEQYSTRVMTEKDATTGEPLVVIRVWRDPDAVS